MIQITFVWAQDSGAKTFLWRGCGFRYVFWIRIKKRSKMLNQHKINFPFYNMIGTCTGIFKLISFDDKMVLL